SARVFLLPTVFFYPYCDPLPLPSFPTRRSSDLVIGAASCGDDDDGNGVDDGVEQDLSEGVDDLSQDLSEGVSDASDEIEEQVDRSEEHTSELQSRENLVCRLLLEKKNTTGVLCV